VVMIGRVDDLLAGSDRGRDRRPDRRRREVRASREWRSEKKELIPDRNEEGRDQAGRVGHADGSRIADRTTRSVTDDPRPPVYQRSKGLEGGA